jgi:hypothetical protein
MSSIASNLATQSVTTAGVASSNPFSRMESLMSKAPSDPVAAKELSELAKCAGGIGGPAIQGWIAKNVPANIRGQIG